MTIINHSYGFVFLHVPENAGTAVAQYLSALTTYRDQEIGATDLGEGIGQGFKARFGLGKHATYQEIEKVMGGATLRRYRTIAVASDPYDRAYSAWAFLQEWHGWHGAQTYARFAADIADWNFDEFLHSQLFEMPGPGRVLMPQMFWLSGGDGDDIAVDHLLRIESLPEDLEHLIDKAGWPRSLLGPSFTSVDNFAEPTRASLDAGARDIIHHRYEADFKVLGY